METIEKKLERYSFSKLSSFHTCKYGYKLTYIDHLKGDDNCFALYGSLVHSIMERYVKKEISLWDLPKIYEWEFDTAVNKPFPKSKFCDMRQTYYNQGLKFLNNFLGYDDYKILEVENNFDIQIDDWIFTGIMDLLYEDQDGNLILLDYKSKAGFKNKLEKQKYARQLYLYCLYIKEKYGRFPAKLKFSMFRKQEEVEIDFNEDDFQEAIIWAKYTVQQIRHCTDFSPNCEDFYSTELCNHRAYCEMKVNNTDNKRRR